MLDCLQVLVCIKSCHIYLTTANRLLTLTLILRAGCLHISYCDLEIIETFENHRIETLLGTTYYSERDIL